LPVTIERDLDEGGNTEPDFSSRLSDISAHGTN